MDRRNFLKTSLQVAGGAWLLGAGRSARLLGGNRSIERIGVQLYTLRSLMREDFDGTLKRVAEVGYREVEFAGYYDRGPSEVKSLLSGLGLDAPATHVSLNQVQEDELDRTIESARAIGHRYLVVPSLPQPQRNRLDFYREVSDLFNRAGERCRQAGLGLAYHNHAFEFEPLDGQIPYDVLLESTEPELVTMELDLFWIRRGGHDPLAYFERYPGRFALCHVKDMDDSGEMLDVGSGVIDFAAIFARSEQAGLKHYIVEHDRPESPIDSIRNSYRYLAVLRF
jgi:sugar phosphate isomerase/epimerase